MLRFICLQSVVYRSPRPLHNGHPCPLGLAFYNHTSMTRTRWILIGAILLFFWLSLNSMVGDSPTMDEQNHLARGLAFLRTGDPRLSVEHPPLVNSLSALPLLLLPDVSLPTDHPSWSRPEGWYEFAEIFLWQVNDDVTRMVFLGRLPIVFLTLALATVGYHFARALWRSPAGALAFVMLLFDPNILAHGRYATTDLGGTLFVFLAAFLLWRYWREPSGSGTGLLLAGLGLGLAYSSKLSSLAFVPIFGLLAVLPLYDRRWRWQMAAVRLLCFILANVIALIVVWIAFGLQWGPLRFQTPQLAWLTTMEGPMPTFWSGIEQILLISEGGRPAFLLGETSTQGFLAYFPVAFLAKTPSITLILFAIALIVLFRRTSDARRAAGLLIPAVLFFALSMQSGLNIGYRHLLPILPFIYVMIAGMLVSVLRVNGRTIRARFTPQTRRAFALIPIGLLLLSTIDVHPHYLSFFNIVAGGPENGYTILVDSNVDWGQDLLRLQAWMRENDVSNVHLSWFGTADPQYYGISYEPLPGLPRHFDLWWNVPFDPQNPEPGTYAISVSNLWELPMLDDKVVFPWFRARPPDDRVAYSILIYEVK